MRLLDWLDCLLVDKTMWPLTAMIAASCPLNFGSHLNLALEDMSVSNEWEEVSSSVGRLAGWKVK